MINFRLSSKTMIEMFDKHEKYIGCLHRWQDDRLWRLSGSIDAENHNGSMYIAIGNKLNELNGARNG